MHYIVYIMRACQHNAILVIIGFDSIDIYPTIHCSNTVIISVSIHKGTIENFTVNSTCQLTINNFIVMLRISRDSCSPIYNRVTSFTECSSNISFCTICRLIRKSNRSMNVSCTMFNKVRITTHGLEVCVHLCINLEFFIGKSIQNRTFISVNICNLTHINIYLQVVRPESILCPNSFGSVSGNLHIGIKVNYTNWELCQNRLTTTVNDTSTSE